MEDRRTGRSRLPTLLLAWAILGCRDGGPEDINLRLNRVEDAVRRAADRSERVDRCLTDRLDPMMRDSDIVVTLRECLRAGRTWR